MHLADAFIQSELQCIQAIHEIGKFDVTGDTCISEL